MIDTIKMQATVNFGMKIDSLIYKDFKEQKYERCLHSINALPSTVNQIIVFRILKAACLIKMQQYEIAHKILDDALQINPCHANLHYTKGLLFFSQGHLMECIQCMDTVLELSPSKFMFPIARELRDEAEGMLLASMDSSEELINDIIHIHNPDDDEQKPELPTSILELPEKEECTDKIENIRPVRSCRIRKEQLMKEKEKIETEEEEEHIATTEASDTENEATMFIEDNDENYDEDADADETYDKAIQKAKHWARTASKDRAAIRKRAGGKKRKNHFICHLCSRSFTTAFSLQRHFLLHTGARPYRCGKCARTFVQRSDLDRHEATHQSKRNFICDTCQKGFKTKKNLHSHCKTHSNARPFRCSLCPKNYKIRRLLREHEAKHQNTVFKNDEGL